MGSKTLKWLSIVLISITLLVAIAITAAITWVATGPRSLTLWIPHIEASLTAAMPSLDIAIDDAIVDIGGIKHPLNIQATNIKIINPEDGAFISFPKASADMHMLQLLTGRIVLSDMVVYEPELWLFRSEGAGLQIGLGERTEEKQGYRLEDFLGLVMVSKERDIAIESIKIEDASLLLGDQQANTYWRIPNADMQIIGNEQGIIGNANLAMPLNGEIAQLKTDFVLLKEESVIKSNIVFDNINPSLLAGIVPNITAPEMFKLPLSGRLSINVGFAGDVRQTKFHISGGPGEFSNDKVFEAPITIAGIEIEGNISEDLSTLHIQKARLDLSGPVINMEGDVTRVGQSVSMDMEAGVTNLPVDDLARYWPITLAPRTREWVTSNITTGAIPHASTRITLHPPEDPQKQDGSTINAVITAEVEAEGVTVDYFGNLPKATDVNGTVTFTGRRMDIAITSGKALTGTRITTGAITVPDMLENPEMEIELDLNAPATDVAQYLSHDLFNYTDWLNIDPTHVTGDTSGTVALTFPMRKEQLQEQGLAYDIKAQFKGVTIPRFMHAFDIADTNTDFKLTNKSVKLNGSTNVNTLNPQSEDTAQEQDIRTLPFLTGGTTFDIAITHGPVPVSYTATIGLNNALVELDDINYTKPKGEKGNFTFKAKEKNKHTLTINAFNADLEGLTATGSGTLNTQTFALQKLNLTDFKQGYNDFSLSLSAPEGGNYTVNMQGNSIDLTNLLKQNPSKSDLSQEQAEETKTTFHLEADIKRVVFGEDQWLNNLKGNAKCPQGACTDVNFNGTFENGQPITLTVFEQDNERKIRIISPDAGELVRVLGITNQMQGGVFTLHGTFKDTEPHSPLEGHVRIDDYTLRKAPVLAKILTLASLSGILDRLNGKGIPFRKMIIPYTWKANEFHFKNAKSIGDSLGILGDGIVNTSTGDMKINGTLIPAYTLNSLFGKIPLLGWALTGDKDGGLFAGTFSVTGTYETPEVGVNPLSILAPGVTRGLVDFMELSAQPQESKTEKETIGPILIEEKN